LGTPPINVFAGEVKGERLLIGGEEIMDVLGVGDCDVWVGVRPEGLVPEENGGLIFPDMQFCRDGGMAIARMLEAIISNGPLSEQLSVLPVYHTVKSKLHCPNNMKSDLAMHFATSVDDDVTVDTTDGVKLIYDDGWVLLRASGTEPLFRVYSESKDRAIAESRAQKYLEMAEGFVNGPSDN
jgi:phosphomannomutase/phosphoglucomutase